MRNWLNYEIDSKELLVFQSEMMSDDLEIENQRDCQALPTSGHHRLSLRAMIQLLQFHQLRRLAQPSALIHDTEHDTLVLARRRLTSG
jgi:hypothetical protein